MSKKNIFSAYSVEEEGDGEYEEVAKTKLTIKFK